MENEILKELYLLIKESGVKLDSDFCDISKLRLKKIAKENIEVIGRENYVYLCYAKPMIKNIGAFSCYLELAKLILYNNSFMFNEYGNPIIVITNLYYLIEDDIASKLFDKSEKDRISYVRHKLRELEEFHICIEAEEDYDYENKSIDAKKYLLHTKIMEKNLLVKLSLVSKNFDISIYDEAKYVGFEWASEFVKDEESIKKYNNANYTSINNYKISDNKKTDFIKIISAMYDLRMFESIDGKYASNKKKLIEDIGVFFNTDIKDYSVLLSKAKSSSANFLDVFDQLKTKAEIYYEKQ